MRIATISEPNLDTIEDVRKIFLSTNPEMKDIDEKWLEYLIEYLKVVQDRCKNKIILPDPPMRHVYGFQPVYEESIYWIGNDLWAPSLSDKIKCIERYYTECRDIIECPAHMQIY
jgi:hypothetical protein